MFKIIAVAASLGFFAWLLANAWVIAVLLLIVAGVIAVLLDQVKQDEARFQQLILHTLRNKVSPEAARANHKLAKVHFNKSQLIRALQIASDCIYLTKTSKKGVVLRERLELLEDLNHEIRRDYSSLMAPETAQAVFGEIDTAIRAGHTNIYLNPARAEIEKAATLKTPAAKLKRMESAKQLILEGLNDPMADRAALEALMQQAG
jgi:hypothetical protein